MTSIRLIARTTAWLAAATLLVTTGAAQEPATAPTDLQPLLATILDKHGVPALGVAVIVDGKLAAIGVDGVRRRGHADPVTTEDRWHLGSCTKAMTATLLARQVAAGKLTWSATVADTMPDLRDGMHETARSITVAQLLQHRAGVPAGPSSSLWNELYRYEGSDADARTAVAAELLGRPVTDRGRRYLYSNAGYMIAGAVAERVDSTNDPSRSWQQLMRDEIFAPLGMNTAGFGPPGPREQPTQPWGHANKSSPPLYRDNPTSMGPAGTVHASLRDWARFVTLHLGIHAVDGSEHPLRKLPLHDLHTPPADGGGGGGGGYALGWAVCERRWAPGQILTHSGSNTMWHCVAWLAPEIDFAVLVTCNQGDAAAACDAVAAACIARFR
ncbi:MAG: serine hydrolase domain-containing protein [Planctomycetota bacterium]